MKKLIFIGVLAIAGCEAQVYRDCDLRPIECGVNVKCVCKDRDHGRVIIDNPPPVEPPVIDQPDPPAEKEVCDGGARACRDGEAPTGTESDPTKYIDRS